MKGIEALGYMLIDDSVIAIRDTRLGGCEASYHFCLSHGIGLTGEQLTSENWEIGRTCEKCDGDGQITVPCPRCSGRSLHNLLENPCCGGYDDAECPDCNGEGIIWDQDY